MNDIVAQITAAHQREQQTNPKAIHSEDIPIAYENISPAWLTQLLCKNHKGAKVIAYQLDVADDGNTNRRRIFIRYNAAGTAAELPTSVFCKASHHLANRLVLANCGLIQGEVSFYKDYRHTLDIEAPNCFLARYDNHSYNSIIVLDDLVRLGAEFCDYDTPISKTRAKSQLNLLAKLHGQFYQSSDLQQSGLNNFADSFKHTDQWFGLKNCCNNGFLAAEKVIPKRLFKRFTEVWPATAQAAELNRQFPLTFTHNDPHLRNWYIAADGEMGLSDWQGIACGHWGRDVAYCIAAGLTVENRRQWEQELLQFYIDKLAEYGGAPFTYEAAWLAYRQHLFTALAWWTLTLMPSSGTSDEPPPDFQPEVATMAFIQRIATAIDDTEALDSFVGND